jgi:hypothetical protein
MKNYIVSLGKYKPRRKITSIMTNHYFDMIIQGPASPEREIREINAPPKLRRGDYTRSLTDNKKNLLSAQNEIEKLKFEINEIYEKLDIQISLLEEAMSEIQINKIKINNIQEILFENSEKIPEGLYIQMMNSLVKT